MALQVIERAQVIDVTPVSTEVVTAQQVTRNLLPHGAKKPLVPVDRLCRAKSKRSGKQCQRAAIRGGTVCIMHGGKAPQVERCAKERLKALVDPAINALDELVNDPAHPHRYIAAKDILDRTGHKPTEKIEVTDTGKRLEALKAGRERARRAREEQGA